MHAFEFYQPTAITFGPGAEGQVGEKAAQLGAGRVLVVYGGQSAKRSGLLDRVLDSLKGAGLTSETFGGIHPNPRLFQARDGVAKALEFGADLILAVGGGSVIDAAKAIALGAANPEADLWDFWLKKLPVERILPVGVVLTISASGSETSDSAVLTRDDTLEKRGLSSDLLRPKFAILNPELTYTLPPFQITCGVVDIMMHTLDRYFSYGGVNEMTDSIAEALLRNVIHYGPICMEQPENFEARSEIMWAGSLSHNHLTGLGKPGDWSPHQLEHELGGKFDVAHGAGLAAIWGAWAYHVYKADVSRFVRYAQNVWGIQQGDATPEETAVKGIEATRNFFHSLGMPITVAEMLGRRMTDEEIEDLTIKATWYDRRTLGNLMVLDKDEIRKVYQESNVEKM